jgi:hypothetical protein
VVKGASDDGRQVVLWRNRPQALSETSQFARLEQFVAARASGKLHGGPLLKSVNGRILSVEPTRLQS